MAQALSEVRDILLVWCAASLSEGRARFAEVEPDVLICDLSLADGSGVELIRELCAVNRRLCVLVVTVFAEQNKVLDCLQAGAQGYLLKENGFEQLGQAIRDIYAGGSPISPQIARRLLGRLRLAQEGNATVLGEILSAREMEVLKLLARGFTYEEISVLLGVSGGTIATYVKRLYRKLEVTSRSEAVFEAASRGIIDVG